MYFRTAKHYHHALHNSHFPICVVLSRQLRFSNRRSRRHHSASSFANVRKTTHQRTRANRLTGPGSFQPSRPPAGCCGRGVKRTAACPRRSVWPKKNRSAGEREEKRAVRRGSRRDSAPDDSRMRTSHERRLGNKQRLAHQCSSCLR